MVYIGLMLVRSRRQHAFGGNEFPDKSYLEPMDPLENHGLQDLLRRFCCAVPMFPASEWIMGHVSSRNGQLVVAPLWIALAARMLDHA